jgi:hypothetical protein
LIEEESLMKRLAILILAVFMVGFLIACSGGGDGGTPKAALQVTDIPNPVMVSNDGKWHYRSEIRELNGIGVEITGVTFTGMINDEVVWTSTVSPAEFAAEWDQCGGTGSTRVEGGSERCGNRVITWNSLVGTGKQKTLVTGMDDLGNSVEGTRELTLTGRAIGRSIGAGGPVNQAE